MGLGVLSRPVWKAGGSYKVCVVFSLFLAWCLSESLQLIPVVLLLLLVGMLV